MAQTINFRQSCIYNLPINTTRPAQVGDKLLFTGEVRISTFQGRSCEKPIFTDLVTGDEVVMPISTLMRAKGTIKLFIKDFDTVGEVLEVALQLKVVFNITGETFSIKETPNGLQVRVRSLTIDREN